MTAPEHKRSRGREAEARRNDQHILQAALDVFTANRRAPMSAVAERAGVGQASLYRRYPSRDALLARVCERGMTGIREAAVGAAAAPGDPWAALEDFVRWYLESGTPQLAGLLGSFVADEPLFELARAANDAIQALVTRAQEARRLRDDVTGADVTLLVTRVSALEQGDPERSAALRDRYLTLVLQGLARRDVPPLPGPPPDAAELEQPWRETRRRPWPGSQ